MPTRLLAALVVAGLAATASAGSATASPAEARSVSTVAAPTRPDPLLPNVVPLKARDLSIVRSEGSRVLRFESGLANTGRGPLEVRPNRAQRCSEGQRHASQVLYRDVDDNARFSRRVDTEPTQRSAGCMLLHPAHDHWHFEAAAQYRLTQPGGDAAVVAGRKASFCLRDSERVPPSLGTFRQPHFYGACERDTPQGVSPGWVDVYQSSLPGQSLPLPGGTPNGLFCLRTTVDPRDQLVESREDDNQSLRGLRIRGTTVLFAPNRRCRT